VVIKPDKNKSKSHNKDIYATFKEAIKVEDYKASYLEDYKASYLEDYKASYLEALWFRVNLLHSSFLTFFLTFY